MALQAWGATHVCNRCDCTAACTLTYTTYTYAYARTPTDAYDTRICNGYVMALQAWVAAKRTRDFDEADRIREAMLAAGMRIMSK